MRKNSARNVIVFLVFSWVLWVSVQDGRNQPTWTDNGPFESVIQCKGALKQELENVMLRKGREPAQVQVIRSQFGASANYLLGNALEISYSYHCLPKGFDARF